MGLPDVVRNKVQRVGRDLPVRDQGSDEVINGQVGVFIHTSPNPSQVPAILARHEPECGKIERRL
jgi:hypothetical protein